MAKYQPYPNTSPLIWYYHPDDTDDTFYIVRSATFREIADRANEKWPGGYVDLWIESEYIHTDYIYHDLYDPSDYTNFLKITRII